MVSRGKRIRRALGAPISALMLVLSVAVPLLDTVDLRLDPVVESQHDPSSCAPSHDHTVCTQVGANHALPTREGIRSGTASFDARAPLGARTLVLPSVLAEGHPTRAPPSA